MSSQDLFGPAWRQSLCWPLTVMATVVIGSLALACMMPFSAVAVMLALALPLRRAMLAMAVIWSANQLIGYLLLDYPVTVNSFSWGAALGLAALAGLVAARQLLALRKQQRLATLAMAFAASFCAYEVSLFLVGVLIGDTGAFTASIIATILLNDSLWFAGLMLLQAVAMQLRPRWFERPAAHIAG